MPWIQEPPLPAPRAMFAAATSDAPAGGSGAWIYAIGGADAAGNPATDVAYDTQAHSWSPIAALPTPRGCLAATSTPGGVHALGGFNGTSFVAAHEIYEPATNAWSAAKPLLTARSSLAAVTGPDGLVYALGGWVGGGGGSNQVLAVVEAYDPTTGAWAPKAPMPTPRGGLAAVTAGGLIYALGGADGHSVLATVETYDPKADKWTPGSPLPAARAGLAAAVGPNGEIYAIGGNGADGTSTASVYSYDPATPAAGWAQQDPLSTERSLLAATGIEGLVYAIGGYTSAANSDLDTVEAYMPYGFEQQVLNDLKKMGIVGILLGGVARGSAGGVVIGKHFIPIPPRSPVMAFILGAAAPYLGGAIENPHLGQLIQTLRPDQASTGIAGH
ncbi:Kelch repeat-containing protein [Mycolicibacterium moriokaense]|uniref:Kelch motif protein n=1 Tax=Mycolicibacterium moriokaense TaxID=39691 RepID=A0A318H1W7_9MYCO|nr:hypothetical protein [Mycolicibacterium moriokaense]PXW97183.1 Kelch motif protein [Mycolicibacterium moriokaense]